MSRTSKLYIDSKALKNQIKSDEEMACWNPEHRPFSSAYPFCDVAPFVRRRIKANGRIRKGLLSLLFMVVALSTLLYTLDKGIENCMARGATFEQCIK